MHKPDFRYLVLWVFLFGIIVIVFLQVISGYNIRRLTEGNKRLLNELRIQNTLRRLETDILTVESDIRGAVISGKEEHLNNTEHNTLAIQREMNSLHSVLTPDLSLTQFNTLSRLINEKKAFNDRLLS